MNQQRFNAKYRTIKRKLNFIYDMVTIGHIKSAFTIKQGGIAEAIAKMSFGNKLEQILKQAMIYLT